MKTINKEEILQGAQSKNVKSVSEIKLHQKELSSVPSLKEFSSLKTLDVSCNRLKHLGFVSSNTNLTTLLAYDNEISDLNGLCQLNNLNTFHAQYNQVKNIDTCFYNLTRLTDLRLDENEISNVNKNALRQCTVLKTLDLSYNLIENVDFLAGLPNLACLTLSHNRLKSIASLNHCPKLTELDVSDNLLTVHGMEDEGFMQMERLNLSNNKIESLGSNVAPHKALVALLLNGNQLHFLPKLDEAFPNLDVLEISDNKFTNLDDLLDSISGCTNLRELSLKENAFELENKSLIPMAKKVKRRLPQLACLNSVFLDTILEPGELSGTGGNTKHQREIYQLIEDQLSHLSVLTAPLEESLTKSFTALQDVLTRLELEESTEQSENLAEDERSTRNEMDLKEEDLPIPPDCSSKGDAN